MKRNIKIALFTNIFLAVVLVAVGTVCFFPFGAMTAGKLSDRVYYNGNKDSNYISIMFNVYGGTEYISEILDTLDVYKRQRLPKSRFCIRENVRISHLTERLLDI